RVRTPLGSSMGRYNLRNPSLMTVELRNVFILGTTYCGSTLLGNALNAHSSIAFAGEISRLPAFGIGPALRVICPLCYVEKVECPIWTQKFRDEVSAHGAGKSLDVYREAVRKPVIVDGSKHVAWLRRVHAEAPLPSNTFLLIAVRSPLGFVHSTQRRDHWEAW